MEFLTNYGLFLAKTIPLLAAIAVVIGIVVSLSLRRRSSSPEHVQVRRINDRYRDLGDALEVAMLDKSQQKQKKKTNRIKQKADQMPILD